MSAQSQPNAGRLAMSKGKYGKQQVRGTPAQVEGVDNVFTCHWSYGETNQGLSDQLFGPQCLAMFADAGSLYRHLRSAHCSDAVQSVDRSDRRKRVRICGWAGCDEAPKCFVRHLEAHAGYRAFPCTFEGCGKMFAASQKLREHAETHTEDKHQCSTCGRMYSTSERLRQHKQAKHGLGGPHQVQCPVQGCQYTDRDSSNLCKHKRDHSETAPVCMVSGCEYRDKVFASNTRDKRPKGMWDHMRAVHTATEDMRAQAELDHKFKMSEETSAATPAAFNAALQPWSGPYVAVPIPSMGRPPVSPSHAHGTGLHPCLAIKASSSGSSSSSQDPPVESWEDFVNWDAASE